MVTRPAWLFTGKGSLPPFLCCYNHRSVPTRDSALSMHKSLDSITRIHLENAAIPQYSQPMWDSLGKGHFPPLISIAAFSSQEGRGYANQTSAQATSGSWAPWPSGVCLPAGISLDCQTLITAGCEPGGMKHPKHSFCCSSFLILNCY